MSVPQEMDISPLSEQSHNTRSVPSLASVPLPISHAACDSYEFRFSLRKPSLTEWLHISTWLPVWVISISSGAKWLLVTKQTLCRLCGTQHCKANNNLGRRETSERVIERQTAVDSWGKSHWWLLHGCTYYTFMSATVGSLRFKSAPSVQYVQHAHRWQPYRCLNSAPCWSAVVESPRSSSTKKKANHIGIFLMHVQKEHTSEKQGKQNL